MMANEKPAAYIFLCNDQTEQECFDRSLLGGKEKYLARVRGIEIGDTAFLYNYKTKYFFGPFTTTSTLKMNVTPEAWNGFFPCQIRVILKQKYKPLHRHDIPTGLIKYDRAGRPTAKLTEDQFATLIRLFQSPDRVAVFNDDRKWAAKDGHLVRSKQEQIIDDWLYAHRIAHGYETQLGKYQCDFEIPTETGPIFIEYWGLKTKEYMDNKRNKIKYYQENNLRMIEIGPKDTIEIVLQKKLGNISK